MIPYADPMVTRAYEATASSARSFSSLVTWTFATLVLLPIAAGICLLFSGFVPLAFGTASVLLIVGATAVRRSRERRVQIVLGYLTAAIRLNLPIPPMLLSAALSEPKRVAASLDRLRAAIEDGSPIGAALATACPHAPARLHDLVAAAERNGSLDRTLPALLDAREADDADAVSGFMKSYLLIMLIVLPLVVGMICIFVIPKFMQIFKDFKTELPSATMLFVQFNQAVLPVVGIIAAIIFLVAVGQAFRQLLTRGKPLYNPLRPMLDRLRWYTPIVGLMMRDRGLADACSVIATALDATRPIDAAIREADMPHLNGVLRTRLDLWARGVVDGLAIPHAAQAARLPALVVGMLGPAVRSGNVPDAMRFLSRHYNSTFSRSWYLLRGAMVPATVLLFGAFVLLTLVALFAPLVSLIQAMSVPRGRPW